MAEQQTPKVESRSVDPSQRYFFQYFRRARPYLKGLKDRLVAAARFGGVQEATTSLFDAITHAARERGVPAQKLLQGNFLALETMASQMVVQHDIDGQATYDIAPALVEAFLNSRTGEMTLADAPPPARTVYLHFGAQPTLLLHGSLPVEGALLASHGPDWRFSLVARHGKDWLMPGQMEFHTLRIPKASLGIPFSDAVDLAIDADERDIEAARLISRKNAGLSPDQPGPSEGLFDLAREQLARNQDVLREGLSLVGNALAYLAAYPDDAKEQWQPGAPEAMVLKAARPGKEGERALSKLLSMGYARVRMVGYTFEQSIEEGFPAEAANEEGAHPHGSPRTHWRQGHWRNQAYGPSMSLRKLLWIRPVLVKGQAAG